MAVGLRLSEQQFRLLCLLKLPCVVPLDSNCVALWVDIATDIRYEPYPPKDL